MSSNYSDFDYKLNTTNKDIIIVKDSVAIENSIRNIITTQKGSLVGNPDFGTDLENVLFDIMDDVTYQFMRDIIEEELAKSEPRISITDIDIIGLEDTNQIIVNIKYIILTLNDLVNETIIKINI